MGGQKHFSRGKSGEISFLPARKTAFWLNLIAKCQIKKYRRVWSPFRHPCAWQGYFEVGPCIYVKRFWRRCKLV